MLTMKMMEAPVRVVPFKLPNIAHSVFLIDIAIVPSRREADWQTALEEGSEQLAQGTSAIV